MEKPIIGVGADDAGFWLKEAIRKHLTGHYEIVDFGVATDDDKTEYPEIGLAAAEAVADGRIERAILVCGTGIGMAISANKVPGVRAAVAADQYSVERSVLSNNCQVLTLGSRVVAPELALRICDQWLSLSFDPRSHSANNLEVLARYEARHPGGDSHGAHPRPPAENPPDTDLTSQP